jgi:Raf kinase inhibitor-like YbhB/YbcL family protein
VTYSPQPATMPTILHGPRAAIGRIWRQCRHASRSFLLVAGLAAAVAAPPSAAQAGQKSFTLVSPTVRTGATMPVIDVGGHGDCKGSNQSPPLVWLHPPDGTQGYAVSMADLDAKVGVVWLWLMFNIPASVTALQQNAAADPTLRPPAAAQAKNGFDTVGYLGPCPRRGTIAHHYLITVWALNADNLPFKDGTSAQTVAIYLRRHALGHANLTPHYGGSR